MLLIEVLVALVLTLLGSAVVLVIFFHADYTWHWRSVWECRVLIAKGWAATLGVSVFGITLSIVVAVVLMLGQSLFPLRVFTRACVEVVRGIPLLALLLLGYYGVAPVLHLQSPLVVGVILLAVFEGAYLAEIFRGAWESIGASQLEAARAVGFSREQTWRHVIFPQAFRRALPGTAGQMVSLVKDSSLLSVIGVAEVTQMVRAANAQAYTALEGYAPLAVLYLALTLPLTWWARRLEARFKFET